MNTTTANVHDRVAKAVQHYWLTRNNQAERQSVSGTKDQGARGAVTGGAQMDGFMNLMTDLITEVGVGSEAIFHNKHLELPGFFRPTKEWDLLVVRDGQLILALEAKSQVGPSSATTSTTAERKQLELRLIISVLLSGLGSSSESSAKVKIR